MYVYVYIFMQKLLVQLSRVILQPQQFHDQGQMLLTASEAHVSQQLGLSEEVERLSEVLADESNTARSGRSELNELLQQDRKLCNVAICL